MSISQHSTEGVQITQQNQLLLDLSLFSDLQYNFHCGPLVSFNEATKRMNCQLALHVALEEFFGLALPKYLRSKELFYNRYFLQTIHRVTQPIETMQEFDFTQARRGDIFFFSKTATAYARRYHLAVYLGEKSFFHAVQHHGFVLWSVDEFVASKHYSFWHGVRRVK